MDVPPPKYFLKLIHVKYGLHIEEEILKGLQEKKMLLRKSKDKLFLSVKDLRDKTCDRVNVVTIWYTLESQNPKKVTFLYKIHIEKPMHFAKLYNILYDPKMSKKQDINLFWNIKRKINLTK